MVKSDALPSPHYVNAGSLARGSRTLQGLARGWTRGHSNDEYQAVGSLLLYFALAGAHPFIGEHVSEVPLVGLDGEAVVLPANETAAVVFFATWCEPCHAAIADLQAIHRARGGFNIVLVGVGEDATKVRDFLKQRNLTGRISVALDKTGAVARAWGQDRFPTTFLVDGGQIIQHINRGYGRGFRARVERWLRAMAGAG
jgi:thiol-disulfide isomerase/thioredoxin